VTAALTIVPTPRIPQAFLVDDDRDLLAYLLGVIGRCYKRNEALSLAYDSKRLVRSLGMAIPPEFDALKTVCGWSGTVVDVLNERRMVDHIEVGGSAEFQQMVDAAWDDNDLDAETTQFQATEMVHGIGFCVVAPDPDVKDRVIVLPTPATRMTVEYDRAKRRATAAASNDEALRPGDPRQATLYTRERTVVVELTGGRYRILDEFENPAGVIPVERFVNRQRLDAQWGRSEITPAVLSYTDRAVRTMLSMEVAREAYSMPKEFIFNAAQEAFQDAEGNAATAWDMFWGRFKALSGNLNDEGELLGPQPDVKQLPASSPATLIDMIKMDSQLLAAETGIPPSNLGFVSENPPSGDGMRMYENRLVKRAKMRNRSDGAAYGRVSRLVLLARGVPVEQLPQVRTVWVPEETSTPAADTDAITKQVTAGIVPASSDVALEKLGYDREQVERIQLDRDAAPLSDAELLASALDRQAQVNTALAG
jgi:hypothetical protein